MRALITGIGGFVGPYLADSFVRSGIECVGIVAPDSTYVASASARSLATIDVRDALSLRDFVCSVKPDIVVHLAAVSDVASGREHPVRTIDVNVNGTTNLLEAVRALGKPSRILLVSSGAVYGDSGSESRCFTECDAPNPTSTYATSKLMAELVARCYVRDFDLNIVVARPFNHTGPGQADSFVCSGFARQIAESMGRSKTLSIRTGPLHPFRDFTDVRDVVDAYRKLIDSGKQGDVYNICSGRLVSIAEILDLLGQAAGCDVRAIVESKKVRPHEIARVSGDPSKLQNELGWKPQVKLIDTLTDLLEFWREKVRVAA